MENVFPSSNNEPLLRCCSPNKGSASTSRLEEPPFHLHFPSPFLDDVSITDHLIPQQNHVNADQGCETNIFGYPNKGLNINSSSSSTATESTAEKEIKAKKVKRSSGKKDRHSKIHTAHGLRGRRMRLSIHIARKFFDLQDMLGFDKASKTLDWLFSKSKKAIKEVERTLPSEMGSIISQITSTGERGKSTLLECESGLENFTAIKTNARKGSTSEASNSESLMGADAEKKPRKSRKSALSPNDTVARESREKARARARERTMEKMMIKCKEEKMKEYCEWLESYPNSTNLEKLGLGFPANPNNTNMDRKSLGPYMPTIEGQHPSYILMTTRNMNFRSQHRLQERSVQFP